jgi:hypothetical protein
MRLRYLKYDAKNGLRKVKTKTGIILSALTLVIGSGGGLSFALLGSANAAVSTNYSIFGDATIVPNGNPGNAVQATTTGGNAYGGVSLNDLGGLTVGTLQTLSTDYEFTGGTCGSGSPRFSVSISNGTTTGNLFFYLGEAPNYNSCSSNVWTLSGNLANSANLVDASQVGGTFYEPYSQVVSSFGDFNITAIYLLVDGTSQTVRFDNTQINDTTYTYEAATVINKDSCKNSGWKSFTDSNGNLFKNQGQCVSYVASNGKSQH